MAKYVVLIPADEDAWEATPQEEKDRVYNAHMEFAKLLAERGHSFVEGAELVPSAQARIVTGSRGRRDRHRRALRRGGRAAERLLRHRHRRPRRPAPVRRPALLRPRVGSRCGRTRAAGCDALRPVLGTSHPWPDRPRGTRQGGCLQISEDPDSAHPLPPTQPHVVPSSRAAPSPPVPSQEVSSYPTAAHASRPHGAAACVCRPSGPTAPATSTDRSGPTAPCAGSSTTSTRDRIRHTIETLVGFGTRHTLSTQTDPHRGIGAARDWIFRRAAALRRRLRRPDDRRDPVLHPARRRPGRHPDRDQQRDRDPARARRSPAGSTSSPATTTPGSPT